MPVNAIRADTFSELKQILQPDTEIALYQHIPPHAALEYLAALDFEKFAAAEWKIKTGSDGLATLMNRVKYRAGARRLLPNIQIAEQLDSYFPEAAGHPGQIALISDIKNITRNAIKLFRPAGIQNRINLKTPTSNQYEFAYHDDYSSVVRMFCTLAGPGMNYRERPPKRLWNEFSKDGLEEASVPLLTISVHKGTQLLPSKPLWHAAPKLEDATDSRLTFLLDMTGGECHAHPAMRKAAHILNATRSLLRL